MIAAFTLPAPALGHARRSPSEEELLSAASSPEFQSFLRFSENRNAHVFRLLGNSEKLAVLHRLAYHSTKLRTQRFLQRHADDVNRRRSKVQELRDRDVALLLRRGQSTAACESNYDTQLYELQYSLDSYSLDLKKQKAAFCLFQQLSRLRRAVLSDTWLSLADVLSPSSVPRPLPHCRFAQFVFACHRSLVQQLVLRRAAAKVAAHAAAHVFELKKAAARLVGRTLRGVRHRQTHSAVSRLRRLLV